MVSSEIKPQSIVGSSNDYNLPAQPKQMITIYRSPINDKEIYVYCDSKGRLSGVARLLYEKGCETIGRLPVLGVPSTLLQMGSICHLRSFFSRAHMIAERGFDGNIAHLHVHLSVDGGIKPQIPFQPGLSIGSVVNGESLDKMEEYADAMAKVEGFREQIRTSKQRLEELAKERALEVANPSLPTPNPFISIIDNEIAIINTYLKDISSTMSALVINTIPVMAHFHAGVRSPIDFEKSPRETDPRGFDSLNFNSQYIETQKQLSEIRERMSTSSSSSSASVSRGWGPFSASVAASWASGAADRVGNILKSDTTEGVLVVNAVVTTRNVRTFKHIEYDIEALRQILSVMKAPNPSDEELKRYGITKIVPQKNPANPNAEMKPKYKLYILTEAVMGGSFTGIITILKKSSTQGHRETHGRESSSSTQTSAGFSVGFFGSGKAAYSNASQSASQSEEDILRNSAHTRIKIEIIVQGVITPITRDMLERELVEHVNLNPAKFELSQTDLETAKVLINGTPAQKAVANQERTMKMDAAQVALLNTVRGLKTKTVSESIHSPATVHNGYDHFSERMTEDDGAGVPVGFYYDILDEERIEREIKKAEKAQTSTANPTAALNTQDKAIGLQKATQATSSTATKTDDDN